MKQKYIILDRDGVINYDSPDYIKSPDEWEPIARSLKAIKKLTDNNFNIIIISNQSGVDRGLISPLNFIEINTKMITMIEKSGGTISAVLYCPSLPSEDNPNRKPNPGMYFDIAERMNINLPDCYSVGDSPRDIQASLAAGCKPIAVRTGNGALIEYDNQYNVPIFDDLLDAVDSVVLN